MSLDIYLMAGACPNPCEHCDYESSGERQLFHSNITHNLARMWSAAGCYEALYESDGHRAEEIRGVVAAALAKMRAEPETYRQYNAKNGWGMYEHAVPWLRDFLTALETYPSAVIGVSR
jgi:hypothetical protein